MSRLASPAALPAKDINKALSNTAYQVFSGAGVLNSMYFENDDAADVYVQVFDAALVGDVTVGTTPAAFEIKVPAGAAWGRDPNEVAFHYFTKGCVVAVTSTRTGSGAPGAAAQGQFWYAVQ